MTGQNEVALIVGGGPGISASCARLFSREGMQVAVAARTPVKPVLVDLEKKFGVRTYRCDAAEPAAVEALFESVTRDLASSKQQISRTATLARMGWEAAVASVAGPHLAVNGTVSVDSHSSPDYTPGDSVDCFDDQTEA